MKVSFIIPIYKVELYLEQCVNSVLDQTYRDIEVILVDDGSPDRCPAICDSYAEQDSRVKVLHKPNGGLSDARNAGLKIATGDYVIFMDSDDFWINKECLQGLMDIIREHPECDFVNFNCSYYYPETDTYKKWIPFDEKLAKPMNKDTVICSLVSSGTVPMSACLKVISRKTLLKMNLNFIRGIISEDVPWFIDLLDGTTSCMFVNHYIYAYRKGVVGSITSNKSYSYKNFSDLLSIVDSELVKITKRTFSDDAKRALLSFLAYEVCILLGRVHMLEEKFRNEGKRRLRNYMYLFEYTDNPKVRKVALVYKYLGFNLTELFLRIFMDSKQIKKK